jgi:hypothetical protein
MSESSLNAPVVLEAANAGRIEVGEYEDPGSAALDAYVRVRQTTLRSAMEQYDLVGATHDPVNGSFVVLADRGASLSVDTGFREMGSSHPSPFTAWTREEWNPKLRDKDGLREYYRMKRADGIVRGALRLLKTPIQAGRWFVEPASDSARDKKIAEFIAECIFDGLNVSWSNLLGDILLMCEYGYMTFEKVFERNAKQQIVLRKLSPRHPLDIREWLYDENGGPFAVMMEQTEMNNEPVIIPISKLANFALEPEAGDMSGISVLRSAYKHYYYKDTLYKIDAIQKERHGIGVPLIKLPPGYSPADKAAAEQLGRNLRTNERAHIVLPPMWEVMFAVLEGQPVDCMKSIEHHNMQIMANILAPFLDDSSVDPKSTDMFLKSTRYIGLTVCDVFNHHVIPQLVDFNFRLGTNRKYPKMRVRRIGEWEDIRTMSFALRNFVGAGAVIPDDILEDFLRGELDLPRRDEETSRGWVIGEPDPDAEEDSVDTNQPKAPKPGRTGLPRQAKTPQVGSKKSQGRDVSGGR